MLSTPPAFVLSQDQTLHKKQRNLTTDSQKNKTTPNPHNENPKQPKQNNPQQAIPKKHTIQTHKEPKQSLKTSTHYQVLKHHTHTPNHHTTTAQQPERGNHPSILTNHNPVKPTRPQPANTPKQHHHTTPDQTAQHPAATRKNNTHPHHTRTNQMAVTLFTSKENRGMTPYVASVTNGNGLQFCEANTQVVSGAAEDLRTTN